MESMKKVKRTHLCTELSVSDIGRQVTVCGWVQRRRDLGGLVFVDVRDRSGIIQCVFDESDSPKVFGEALTLRSEYTVAVTGTVRSRGEGAVNLKMETGAIEVLSGDLRIFSKSETPPFEIVENSDVNEQLRMKYRYLDLRRPDMQRIIRLRHELLQATRRFYTENGFYEIETPIMTKSTPEGARDYLVPSRLHPGKFYALPQSPQQYKQLLMIAGFDRYFQIVRCFRDEDLRADRQPEFTQIDIEMSFVDTEDVLAQNERYMRFIFNEIIGYDTGPIPRMTYADAIARYGTDKPDLRFGCEIQDLSECVRACGFKVFEDTLAAGGVVRGFKIEGGASSLSRKEIDALGEFVKTYRARGLAWAKLSGAETSSSFLKFMNEDAVSRLKTEMGAQDGDVLFLIADTKSVAAQALGALRVECGRKLGLMQKGFKPLWIVDFPFFEYDEENTSFTFAHHPFTCPHEEDLDKIESDPAAVRAKAYDFVINGYELSSGSIRIHDTALQSRMFRALGMSEEETAAKFGHMLEAFKYGAPPHGGLAFGLDRLAMLLAGTENIKDVIAFPKMQNAAELMMGSPDSVDSKQLDELHIGLKT